MTATEVLVKMLERFNGGRRWCPDHFEGEGRSRRYCLIAMAARVIRGCEDVRMLDDREYRLLQQVQQRLDRAIGLKGAWELPEWNDRQRDFGTVRAAILAAIEGGK